MKVIYKTMYSGLHGIIIAEKETFCRGNDVGDFCFEEKLK
jgi:hypothetical protein